MKASLRKFGCWWLTLLRSGPVVEIELLFETSWVGLNQDRQATDDRRLTVTVGNGGEAYGGPHYGWRRYNIFTFITSSWFLFRSNYILLELQSKFKGNTQVITIHISCYLNRNTNYNNISCYLNRNTNYNLCLKWHLLVHWKCLFLIWNNIFYLLGPLTSIWMMPPILLPYIHVN